jgi:hypothetical protein
MIRKFNKNNKQHRWTTFWQQKGEPATEGFEILQDYLSMDSDGEGLVEHLETLKKVGGCLFFRTIGKDKQPMPVLLDQELVVFDNNDFSFIDKRIQTAFVDEGVKQLGGVIMVAYDKKSDKMWNKLVYDPKNPTPR